MYREEWRCNINHEEIKKIFETLLAEYAKNKGIRVAYHNVKFTPSANETYLRSHILPALTTSYTLAGDHTQYRGIYQITIVTPLNGGTKIAGDIAGELMNIFKMNRIYYKKDSNEYVQQIKPFHTTQGFVEDAKFSYPMSFEYRCDVN